MVHTQDCLFKPFLSHNGTVSLSAVQLHQSRVEKIHAMLDTSKVCIQSFCSLNVTAVLCCAVLWSDVRLHPLRHSWN